MIVVIFTIKKIVFLSIEKHILSSQQKDTFF